MEFCPITAVGIDVSKGKSTVAIRRPGGEIVMAPFQVHHTASDLGTLISTLRGISGEIRVVMEHTGMYWRPIALTEKIWQMIILKYIISVSFQKVFKTLTPQKTLYLFVLTAIACCTENGKII